MISIAAYPGCAARPWALDWNAFGVSLPFEPVFYAKKSFTAFPEGATYRDEMVNGVAPMGPFRQKGPTLGLTRPLTQPSCLKRESGVRFLPDVGRRRCWQ